MTSPRIRGWVLVTVQLILLEILVFAPAGDAWPVPSAVRAAGIVLRWLGGAAIVLGALTLGRSISAHPEPTPHAKLRTDGPYRFVRHPIYSGIILLAGGIAVTTSSVLAGLAFVLLVGVLSVKARFEERLLTARFPGYSAYAKRTPRFLPSPGRMRKVTSSGKLGDPPR